METNIEVIKRICNNPTIKYIYLDFDGVITHSCQAIVDILNLRNKTNYKGSDVFSWNFKEIDNTLTDKQVEELFNSQWFFENLKPIDGVIDFIKEFKDKVIIVTKSSVRNFNYKIQWLKQYGINVPVIPIPLELEKDMINMKNCIFIDDCSKNLYSSNAHLRIQFREYKDNKNNQREWIKNWNGNCLYSWK